MNQGCSAKTDYLLICELFVTLWILIIPFISILQNKKKCDTNVFQMPFKACF